jgi:hypothetical protein
MEKGQGIMSLGFSSGDGKFSSYVKIDARSGRALRRKNMEKGEQSDVDITENFQAVFDLANIKVGWAYFVTGAAPAYVMSAIGEPRSPRPSDQYKEGFLMQVALPAALGGGVHEFSSTAKAVKDAVDNLHTVYLSAQERAAGKLPVVKINGMTMVESKMPNGQTTRNFSPNFDIISWVDRPASFDNVAASAPAPSATPPATGSTPVPPPAAKAPASVSMDFG